MFFPLREVTDTLRTIYRNLTQQLLVINRVLSGANIYMSTRVNLYIHSLCIIQ
jgi:hypothetical protein